MYKYVQRESRDMVDLHPTGDENTLELIREVAILALQNGSCRLFSVIDPKSTRTITDRDIIRFVAEKLAELNQR